MELNRIKGKIAFISGASSGIGKAVAEKLAQMGVNLILCARRAEVLAELKNQLEKEHAIEVITLAFDVRNYQEVAKNIQSLPEKWRQIDILINNAGLALGLDKAYEADMQDWLTMIQTNVVGLVYLTRQIIPQMVERDSGLIINLGSTAGTVPYPGANVYGASKAFVKQFSLNLRADLAGHHIRVTNIEPGLCEGTEFSTVRFKGDKQRSEKLYEGAHAIQPVDIANTVAWIVGQPPHVNINRIELMPVSQTFGPQPVFREE